MWATLAKLIWWNLLEDSTSHLLNNPLQWRYDERYSVSNHRRIDCLHFARYWPFVRGIHRSPVDLGFSLICARTNGWANNRDASDLTRHRAHYDVTVMRLQSHLHGTNESIRYRGGLLNTLRPRQDGRHFADDIFTCIFSNENCCILIKFSLKYVRKGPIDNNPALFQIMARRRPGDKPLSEPMMVSLLTHICVTRPQWVKSWAQLFRPTDIQLCHLFWPRTGRTQKIFNILPNCDITL